MTMTAEEIVRHWRQAKKQDVNELKVLADLNSTDRDTIRKVLEGAGEPVPRRQSRLRGDELRKAIEELYGQGRAVLAETCRPGPLRCGDCPAGGVYQYNGGHLAEGAGSATEYRAGLAEKGAGDAGTRFSPAGNLRPTGEPAGSPAGGCLRHSPAAGGGLALGYVRGIPGGAAEAEGGKTR